MQKITTFKILGLFLIITFISGCGLHNVSVKRANKLFEEYDDSKRTEYKLLEAIKLYKNALKIKKTDYVNLRIGNCYEHLDKLDSACLYFSIVFNKGKGKYYTESLFRYGVLCIHREKYDEAIFAFKKALIKEKMKNTIRRSEEYQGTAMAYVYTSSFKLAETYIDSAIALDSTNFNFYAYKGMIYQEQNNCKSKRYFQKAKEKFIKYRLKTISQKEISNSKTVNDLDSLIELKCKK